MGRRKQSRKPHATRLVAGVVFALSLFLPAPASAADLNKDEIKQLDSLEQRFFERTYPKETGEARIERIEKLIFGEAHQGDQEDRMQTLMASLPSKDAGSDAGSDGGQTAQNAAGGDDSQGGAAGSTQSGSDPQSADNAAGDASDYPKIDAMEQLLLGKQFKGEPLSKRLDQLELKAFKRTDSDPDLSARVEKLDDYVQKHMHKSVDQIVDPRNVYHYQGVDDNDNVRAPAYAEGPGGGGYGYGGGQTSYGGGSGAYGMNPPQPAYNRSGQQPAYGTAGGAQDYWTAPAANAPDSVQIAWLEQHVYGQTDNPNVPIIDRLKRLEATVFPTEPTDPSASIQAQIHTLVNAVELMHTSNPSSPTIAGAASGGAAAGGASPALAQGSAPQSAGSNFPNWPQEQGYASTNQYQTTQGASTPYSGGQYGANGSQYGGANYASGAAQQGSYPYINPPAGSTTYDGQAQQSQAAAQSNQGQQDDQKHGHPLLKGLAQSLLTVGAMAAGQMVMNKMGTGTWSGRGYGGYGNYGGYGGYGGYGSGFMPGYPMGGMGGMGGIHF